MEMAIIEPPLAISPSNSKPVMGRPRIQLTPEIEESILANMSLGVSLIEICKDKSMPSRDTVLRWQYQDATFAAKCRRAREAAGQAAAERLHEINRKVESGELEAAAANVISGNLKWIASRLASKIYGDKITVSGDEENPLAVRDVTKGLLGSLSTEQLEMIEQESHNKENAFDKAERSFKPKADATVIE